MNVSARKITAPVRSSAPHIIIAERAGEFIAICEGLVSFAVTAPSADAVRKRALQALEAAIYVLEGTTTHARAGKTTTYQPPESPLPPVFAFRPLEAFTASLGAAAAA